MKNLKDILSQKRKVIQEKEEKKRARHDGDLAGDVQRKVRECSCTCFQLSMTGTVHISFQSATQEKEEDCSNVKLSSGAGASQSSDAALPAKQHSILADVEVRRRLRRLGHPVTLFGETEASRHDRYRHVERTFEVMDEGAVGGERANVLLTIQKEDRLKAKEAAMQSSHGVDSAKATPPNQQGNETVEEAEVCVRPHSTRRS